MKESYTREFALGTKLLGGPGPWTEAAANVAITREQWLANVGTYRAIPSAKYPLGYPFTREEMETQWEVISRLRRRIQIFFMQANGDTRPFDAINLTLA